MTNKDMMQWKTVFLLLILPISLSPFMVLYNVEMSLNNIDIYRMLCAWGMIMSYNMMAYTIVKQSNSEFVENQKNMYLHWVFNMFNSSFCFTYVVDINNLSSFLYLFMLMSFMLCYDTKCHSEGFFLSMYHPSMLKYAAFTMAMWLVKHIVFWYLGLKLMSHNFTYQQYMLYLFHMEPSMVMVVFIFLSFSGNWVKGLRFFLPNEEPLPWMKFLHDIKWNYSPNILLDMISVSTALYISDVLKLSGLFTLYIS